MRKITKQGGTVLAPVPVVMVSCAAPEYRSNIITIAWTGLLCSDPVIVSISVRPERYSHAIISQSREFVINLPSKELLRVTDYCGMVSGRDQDKFAVCGLTPVSAKQVQAPLIAEAPVNLECKVSQVIPLGSHDLFIAEMVQAHYAETVLDARGVLDLHALPGVAYSNGSYYQVGEALGTYGFSRK